jgi:cysteine synthase
VAEASSGSTAISEAYFASLLGLPFIAVVPAATSPSKVALIESHCGRRHFVQNSSQVYDEAERIPRETSGHYLDQFTNAERATDWRGNNNIAESIYAQMRDEKHPVPDWIVVGAGTGGTSATIGRYMRYRRHATRLWWSIRRTRRSSPPTPKDEATSSCPRRRASRASAGRGWSRRFCPA